jgi:nicotinamide-nucleotide amidase
MIAEIISIGNELLQGRIDDTNATYISQRLAAVGIELRYRTTVGDSKDSLKEALGRAAERADAVIATGGLGPTADDVTIEAASEFFGMKLERDPEIEKRVKRFYEMIGIPCTENALNQARVPSGAEIIRNPVGTAPGARIRRGEKEFVFLPGVPREMQAMIEEAIKSLALRAGGGIFASRSIRVFGIGESAVESALPEKIVKSQNPTLSFLPHRFEVELRLTARGRDGAECDALIEPAAKEIYARVGEHIYGEGDDPLEKVVFDKLKDAGLTVAFAESCTGGLLGGRFTAVPGASEVFAGSLVTYTIKTKQELLGVPAALLAEFGPVSEQVAKAMAEGAAEKLGADVGVSVTGNAGPTSNDEKSAVGRIYIGLAFRDKRKETVVLGRRIMRARNDVRDIAVLAALDLIRKNV